LIAELNGKISSSASNLSDRREDQLTGDFFGTLRYIPFEKGLLPVLESATFIKMTNGEKFDEQQFASLLDSADLSGFLKGAVSFWPQRAEAEIDVLFSFPEFVVGIEVKYLSGLSSDDEVDNSQKTEEQESRESKNQLAREARMLEVEKKGRIAVLLFLANEADAVYISANVNQRDIIEHGVHFGYLTWQKLLVVMEKLRFRSDLTIYENLIISDITELLRRKGFEGFRGFASSNEAAVDAAEHYSFIEQDSPMFDFTQTVEGDEWYEYRN